MLQREAQKAIQVLQVLLVYVCLSYLGNYTTNVLITEITIHKVTDRWKQGEG